MKKPFFGIIKKTLLIPLVFTVAALAGAFSCLPLRDYQLDRLSYSMIDYNAVGSGDYDPPVLNVVKTDRAKANRFYRDLFDAYHYNLLVGGARVLIDNSTKLVFGDNPIDVIDMKCTTQPTYSVGKENAGTKEMPVYHIDYGQYYAYFPEIVDRYRGQGKISPIFVSDIVADQLIEALGIPGETKLEKYKTLITDENYCFLSMSLDDTGTAPVCINNVLYSTYKSGQSKRMTELYGAFSLLWTDRIWDRLDASFEVDLKTNPYGNKKAIQGFEDLGYGVSNSSFQIKRIKDGIYSKDEQMTVRLQKALTTSAGFVTYLPLIIVQIVSLIFCFVLSKKRPIIVDVRASSIAIFLLFCLYGLVVTFTYNYPLFSLSPLFFLLCWFVFQGWLADNSPGRLLGTSLSRLPYDDIKI